MNINSITYVTSSYKTTNPPISEQNEISVCDNPLGKRITVKNSINDFSSHKEYNLTAEEYNEIVAAFLNLGLREQIFNLTEQGINPNDIPVCGGSFGEQFSFSTECVSTTTTVITNEMRSLINLVNGIIAKHGNPDFENSTGEMPVFGAFAPAAPVQPVPEYNGENACPSCGADTLGGKFCPNCGAVLK